MSPENIRAAAETEIARAALPDEMRGRTLQLVTFASDEDARFFFPRRALIWQQRVNTTIARMLRKRGGRIHRVTLTPEEYHAWRADRDDTPELRRSYADKLQRLLE